MKDFELSKQIEEYLSESPEVRPFPAAAHQGIEKLVKHAATAMAASRRRHGRYPFFRPITVTIGSQATKLDAFSRDISHEGMGLLHNIPLETQPVTVTLPTTLGHQVDISLEIIWCKPCGENWYISGGRFVGLRIHESLTLLLSTFAVEVNRRRHGRYPFFRPITVTIGSQATKLDAFSRDISHEGMGLLHNIPLETQPVTVTLPTTLGHQVDISLEIIWCKPCGENWYISGGRLVGVWLESLPRLFY